MTRVGVELLGPPSVSVDGLVAPLSARQLAVTLRIVLTRQHPIPSARLLTAWPGDSGTDGALRVALTRLRPMLAPAQLTRLDTGYLITPAPTIDSDRFEQLLRDARTASAPPDARLGSVTEALAVWRGPALDGLGDLDWARQEAARLDELHEQAIDLRYELLLASPTGGAEAPGLIAELTADAARLPGREHRAGLLATALYRAGRQSDALTALSTTRRHLRDQLGLHPGRALDELELQILNHDSRLQASPDTLAAHPAIDRQLDAARTLMQADAALAAEPIADAAVGAARSHGHHGQLAESLIVLAHAVMATASRPSDPLIDEAQVHARVAGDGELLAQAALARFALGVPAGWQQALVDLTEPLGYLPPAAPLRVDLLAAAAALVAFSGEQGATEQLLHAAEDTHRAIGSDRSAAVWLATRAIVTEPGTGDRALHDARQAVDLATANDDSRMTVVALHALLRAAFATGALDAADEVLATLDEHSRRAGIAFGRVRVPIVRGSTAIARGNLAEAERQIAATRELGAALGGRAAEPAANAQALLLAFERGTAGPALDTVRQAALLGDAGWLSLAAMIGDADDVDRLRAALPQVVPGDRYRIVLAMTARAAVVHGAPDLAAWVAPRLARLGSRMLYLGFGSLVVGPAPLFVGIAHTSVGRWAEAAQAYAAAEALADAAGAELWRVEARLGQARAHAESGDPARATVLLDGTRVRADWKRLADHAAAVRALVPAR